MLNFPLLVAGRTGRPARASALRARDNLRYHVQIEHSNSIKLQLPEQHKEHKPKSPRKRTRGSDEDGKGATKQKAGKGRKQKADQEAGCNAEEYVGQGPAPVKKPKLGRSLLALP